LFVRSNEGGAGTHRERGRVAHTWCCEAVVVVRFFMPKWSRLPGRGCGVEVEVEIMVIAVVASK
jgi:hypothetical protein